MGDVATAEHAVVGRGSELAVVATFFEDPGSARALVLEGPAGIGKTCVWEASLDGARLGGRRVLSTRAAESELRLSFVGIADLLADVGIERFGEIPVPQRRALEVAVLRSESEDGASDPLAVFAALRSVLAVMAAEEQLVIAVDDVSWLDRASLDALTFVVRRIRGPEVQFLFTRRSGSPSLLERAFEPMQVRHLEIGGLSLGATRLLLSERLGLNPPRRMLRRLFESAAGNPLVALLLARQMPAGTEAYHDAGGLAADLFDADVGSLPAAAGRGLLAVALSAELTMPELTKLIGADGIEAARGAGVLVVDGARVRPAHPLFAAAARRLSSADERRRVHLELARTVGGSARRLHHAALAAPGTDRELAAQLATAAGSALWHGDAQDAIELGEHALRLTPAGDRSRTDRLLALAEYLIIAGELPAVVELLAETIEGVPEGPNRARAHLLLGMALPLVEHEQHLESALRYCGDDGDVRGAALAEKSILLALIRVARIVDAEALARKALRIPDATAQAQRRARHALAWASALRGSPIDAPSAREQDTDSGTSLYESAIDRPAAVRLVWRGELQQARAALTRLLTLAEERGEARSCLVLELHLCELELRVGDTHVAGAQLEELSAWTAGEADDDVGTLRARCRALLAAVRGDPEEAERWVTAALAGSEQSGFVWDRLEALRARGLAALLACEPAAAADSFRAVWDHTRREGVDDPGAFPVAPDLVEALLETGRREAATAVADALRALAVAQRHPWALASVIRCDALLSLVQAASLEGVERLTDAATDYAALGLRFEQGRTLLAAGRAARRLRKWSVAREQLGQALGVFDELGTVGWAAAAREELGRIGGRRRAAAGELTSAERRVAVLAADGFSNKEIASRLVISVSTVETHLRHAYAKLAVRSRAQLGRRLGARDE